MRMKAKFGFVIIKSRKKYGKLTLTSLKHEVQFVIILIFRNV